MNARTTFAPTNVPTRGAVPVLHRPIVRWAIAAGSLALLVVFLLVDDFAASILSVGVGTVELTIAAIAASQFRHRRRAWLLIIAGQMCFVAGDLVFALDEFVLDRTPYPGAADVFYFAAYLTLGAGLATLIRTHRQHRDLGGLIDASIVTVTVTAVLWMTIVDPVATGSSPMLERLIVIGYTAGDVLLMASLVVLAVRRAGAQPWLWLLSASLFVLLVADVGYAHLTLYRDYSSGNAVDALWWIGYTLAALAALSADDDAAAPTVSDRPVRITRRRLVLLAAAALAGPATLLVVWTSVPRASVNALIIGTLVVIALVVVRVDLLARELDDQRAQLAHEASHDSLTGLGNRTLLGQELARAVAAAAAGPDDERATVLCLDLDDFKTVNDLLGHQAGDELLRIVADRLRTVVRPHDIVARLGGDEFAIVLRGKGPGAAMSVAERAIEIIRRPADLGVGSTVRTNASIGIAYGGDGSTPDDLLRDADIAMYAAKRRGKGQYVVFDPADSDRALDWMELRADLTNAIDRRELVVEYQPIVEVDAGTIVGAEALVRWNHPVRGRMPPDAFIPIAEECGLIVPIGAWVLETACTAATGWDSLPHGRICVNVSPQQLLQPLFVEQVAAALSRTGMEPARLVLELTETTRIVDTDAATDVVQRLRSTGVHVALDDFGSGFASVEHLRALPLDMAKLDRTFVQRSGDGDLLPAVVALVHSLGLQTVIEGVETAHQLEIVRSVGARFAQGYYFARPVPGDEIDAVMRAFVPTPRPSADASTDRSPATG